MLLLAIHPGRVSGQGQISCVSRGQQLAVVRDLAHHSLSDSPMPIVTATAGATALVRLVFGLDRMGQRLGGVCLFCAQYEVGG